MLRDFDESSCQSSQVLPSIILHFDSQRYAFLQFSEGSQGTLAERRVLAFEDLGLFLDWLGPTEWKNTGGLVDCCER